MFHSIFSDFHQHISGIRMVGVWGTDGLELQKTVFSPPNVDIDFLGAEVADIIGKINSVQMAPDAVNVKLEIRDGWLYVYRLTREFFLIILTDTTVLNGRLNFYMDLYRPRLTEII